MIEITILGYTLSLLEITFFLLTILGIGALAGFVFCSIFIGEERAELDFYESAVIYLRNQLDEANETIFTLANEKSNLQDTITLLKENYENNN